MTLTRHAKALRKNSTDAERHLWYYLRGSRFLGRKFRRQHPVGPYIADFVCLSHSLIIELDGGHHQQQKDQDQKRTHWLENQGFKVLRFWNHDVLQQTEIVFAEIARHLE